MTQNTNNHPPPAGAPPIGVPMKCLVCAQERPWGIYDGATGATVCTTCRDGANNAKVYREALAFAASTIKSGEPWTDTCEQVIGGALQR